MRSSRFLISPLFLCCGCWLGMAYGQPAAGAQPASPQESDFTLRDFHFASGEVLPELRMHYYSFGKLAKDAHGRASNAVLILHGTSGSGRQFLVPQFAGVLFGPGQPLDASRYFVILPDNIGHGKSTKPSDGLRAHFPQYDYNDMIEAQYRLLTQGLGVDHLRLILGTSMGCMHAWVWGEIRPDFMDALMPLACLPVEIAGRNRVWRKMIIEGIRQDPDWKNGDYTTEPRAGLEIAADFLLIAGSAPRVMQEELPTREGADEYLDHNVKRVMARLDANDFLYAVSASGNYNPAPQLGKIIAPVMFVNSADDFINPPELGIAEREIKKVKNGRFVLLPISEKTHGHGTHTDAAVWREHLQELLAGSESRTAPSGGEPQKK